MKCPNPPGDRNEYSEIDEAIAFNLEPLRAYLKDEDVLVRALPDLAAGFGDRTDSGDLYFVLKEGRANNDDREQYRSETWQLLLVIMLPHRYSKKGVYDVFKKARSLLVGFSPPYSTKAIGAPNWNFLRDESQWVIEASFPFDVFVIDDDIAVEESVFIKRIEIQATDYLGLLNEDQVVG